MMKLITIDNEHYLQHLAMESCQISIAPSSLARCLYTAIFLKISLEGVNIAQRGVAGVLYLSQVVC
jgi:hypothetical protein